ncbi:oxidoreductase [Reyranella soli]|uniref:Oxidoreductase n=1 Tax=Reyranella soli TaxID=1230389 RepID=A0A512N7M1_9HYPH|nr:oxidoreductase [Reyranella soli]
MGYIHSVTKFLGPLDIAVVGCGVAGQAAATLLAETGHRVTVYERFTQPQPVGAGLLLQPTGLAVLRKLGLAHAAIAAGARIGGLEARTHRGRSILDLRYADLHPLAFGVGIPRAALFDLLHGRLLKSPAKLVTGAEIVDVDKTHLVEASGARHGPFDLIVAADGAHSALRARLMPHARAPIYPWGCIWTTAPDLAGIGAAGLLRQRVRGTRLMMGLLPIGHGKVTIYWSMPMRALGRSKTIDLEAWRRTATALWPEAAPIVDHAAAAGDVARATYRHVALTHWNAGPVLFIGDAAHGTSPQLGQGANLGLMDAWVLAKALADAPDLLAAFLRFERRRVPPVRYYRSASHLLTPFFQSRLAPLGWLRDAVMGPACLVPGLRTMMGSTLAGTRHGWLSATPLGDDGCFPLDA